MNIYFLLCQIIKAPSTQTPMKLPWFLYLMNCYTTDDQSTMVIVGYKAIFLTYHILFTEEPKGEKIPEAKTCTQKETTLIKHEKQREKLADFR